MSSARLEDSWQLITGLVSILGMAAQRVDLGFSKTMTIGVTGMGNYTTLLGAEGVERAGLNMESAAERISRAASQMESAADQMSRAVSDMGATTEQLLAGLSERLAQLEQILNQTRGVK